MNCLLCHLEQANHAARLAAIASGLDDWSVTATLLGTGLVDLTSAGFQWNEDRVSADGEASLALTPVSEASCGACHGKVHDGSDPLLVKLDGMLWTSEKTGQIFSPQRISLSGMNLSGKDELDIAWDVHAQRLVSCGDCHYSKGRPQRLAGEATAVQVQPSQGIRRRCESCHSLAGTHDWLPEPERHFKAVACESCHVPELAMGAQQAIDHTVIWPDGSPQVSYRGVEGDVRDASTAYIRGYQPLLRVGNTGLGGCQRRLQRLQLRDQLVQLRFQRLRFLLRLNKAALGGRNTSFQLVRFPGALLLLRFQRRELPAPFIQPVLLRLQRHRLRFAAFLADQQGSRGLGETRFKPFHALQRRITRAVALGEPLLQIIQSALIPAALAFRRAGQGFQLLRERPVFAAYGLVFLCRGNQLAAEAVDLRGALFVPGAQLRELLLTASGVAALRIERLLVVLDQEAIQRRRDVRR